MHLFVWVAGLLVVFSLAVSERVLVYAMFKAKVDASCATVLSLIRELGLDSFERSARVTKFTKFELLRHCSEDLGVDIGRQTRTQVNLLHHFLFLCGNLLYITNARSEQFRYAEMAARSV